MKKFFFLIAAALFSSQIKAEDLVQIVPFHAEKGAKGFDDASVAKLTLNNDGCLVNAMRFHLYLPEGINIDTQYDDPDGTYGIVCDEDNKRFQYKQGPLNKKTGHGATYALQGVEDGMVHYIVIIEQGTNLTPIQGVEGEIADIYYTVASDMADGVYPIYVTAAELTNVSAETKVDVESTTSYVVVGNPSNASLAAAGIIPSFVNNALAAETSISALDLTKVTASNGVFTYVDGRDVVAPSAAVSAEVAYKHSAGSNSYCSVCLPFDATVANAFTFDKIEGESAKFVEASTLAAGVSAIVKGDIDVAGTAEIAAVAGETITTGYYLKNDKFLSVKGSAVIPAMRGNWKSISGVKGFIIDGEETAINAIDADGAQDIYSVAGIKQAKVQKGVNIVNGKKLYVK